jgi:hypothetical protein
MTSWQIIRWWEIRRIPFNAILFVVGIASILAMEWFMERAIPVGEDAIEPFALAIGVLIYAILANLFYTLGWLVELAMSRTDEVVARVRARRMFLAGLWFSCLLTTLPFWFGFVFWLLHRSK